MSPMLEAAMLLSALRCGLQKSRSPDRDQTRGRFLCPHRSQELRPLFMTARMAELLKRSRVTIRSRFLDALPQAGLRSYRHIIRLGNCAHAIQSFPWEARLFTGDAVPVSRAKRMGAKISAGLAIF